MKRKKDTIIFFTLLLCSLAIFYKYLTGHFAADTFRIINIGYEEYAINYSLTDGRIFMAIIGLLANMFHIPILTYIIILQILAIIISCISVIVLKNIIIKYKKLDSKFEKLFLIIVCYYTIFNFTYIENMYFVECFVMSLSILFYILSADKIVEKNKNAYLKATIFIILGLISYQGTISAFFMFVILFFMLKKENYKDIGRNFIKATGIFLIGFLFDNICIILTERIFHTMQIRGFNIEDIFTNIGFIIRYCFYIMKNTSNLFPKYLYIAFIIITSLLIYIKIIKQNRKKYNQYNQIILIEQILIIIFSIACAFIPSVINLTGFWSARMRFSIGAIIGFLFIHIIVKTDILKRNVIWDKLLISTFIIYAIINSINYIYLMNLSKWVNNIDERYVYEINDYINVYEEENNIKVKNIGIVVIKNQVHKAYYEEMNCINVGIAVSSIRTKWATQGIINYYTNRNLVEKEPTEEEKQEYLLKVDESKNYLCINDTLYVSIYMY